MGNLHPRLHSCVIDHSFLFPHTVVFVNAQVWCALFFDDFLIQLRSWKSYHIDHICIGRVLFSYSPWLLTFYLKFPTLLEKSYLNNVILSYCLLESSCSTLNFEFLLVLLTRIEIPLNSAQNVFFSDVCDNCCYTEDNNHDD